MKYYLIGIKGAGMSALALILTDLGHFVVGYDDDTSYKFTEARLTEKGIKIYSNSDLNITSEYIVIRSTAITDDHKEIIRIKEIDIHIYDYHDFLGELTNKFNTIAVSGCHGKTTTSLMLSSIINDKIGCNYLIGEGTGHADIKNKIFIIEACEHYRHFLAYSPSITIITNIDLDHVSHYKDLDDVKEAFTSFAAKTRDLVVVYGDSSDSKNLEIKTKVLYYGFNDTNDVIAKNVIYTEKGINFDVYLKSEFYIHLDLPFYGEHLLLNTLATITVCHYLNIDIDTIKKNLMNFKGAKRRFQETEYNDNIIIDDYAHHPNEIKATIRAVKQKYPNKKIIAVFEPHMYDRTKIFAKDMAKELNEADIAYVLKIRSSDKQENYPDVTNRLIIDKLNNGFHINEGSNELNQYHDSVILFMSSSDIRKRFLV